MRFVTRLFAGILAAVFFVSAVAAAPFPDQATWGGTSGGSANAQTLTIANYAAKIVGVPIRFIPGFTNTSATTFNVSTTGVTAVKKASPAGLTALTGGEIVAAQPASIMWDGTEYVLGLASGQLVTAGYQGLVVTATSATQVTIAATALTATDASGYGYRLASPSVTCAITTSGINGLDTGSETSSTWYSVWDVYNPATLTNGCLLSVSATAPTLPSGYVAKMRVGWVRNDASSNFWRSTQYGTRAQITTGTNPTVPPIVATGPLGSVPSTWSTIAIGSFVPTATASSLIVNLLTDSGTGDSYMAPNSSYSTTVPFVGNAAGPTMIEAIMQLESTNIFVILTTGGASINLLGWIDNL